jgi:hypothetical protein
MGPTCRRDADADRKLCYPCTTRSSRPRQHTPAGVVSQTRGVRASECRSKGVDACPRRIPHPLRVLLHARSSRSCLSSLLLPLAIARSDLACYQRHGRGQLMLLCCVSRLQDRAWCRDHPHYRIVASTLTHAPPTSDTSPSVLIYVLDLYEGFECVPQRQLSCALSA